jgi:uncharacterized membrane protein
VKVAAVITRALIPTHLVLDVKLSVLAVLLGFVVLLPILDQPSTARRRRVFAIALHLRIAGFFMSAFVQLLDESGVRLVPVFPFCLGLRALSLPMCHCQPPLP